MKKTELSSSAASCRNKTILWVILALLLGLGVWLKLSPIAGAGDVRVHVRCAHVFFLGMVDDFGFPDWDATAYAGRGTPMPRYVGPLPLAVAAFFQLIGCDAALSVKMTVLLFALLGLFLLHYWLVSMSLSRAFPWLAIFVMVQPVVGFHLGVALFFQSICASWLSPWLWLAANRVWQGDRRAVMLGGVVFAVLAWTHLLFTVMLGYAWELLMLIGWLYTRQRRFVAAAIGVPVIAGLLAAPYILPLLLTKNDVYYEEVAEAFKPGKLYCEYLDDPVVDNNGRTRSHLEALAVLPGGVPLKGDSHSAVASQGLSILQVISSPERNSASRPWILILLLLSLIVALTGVLRWRGFSGAASSLPGWAWLLAGGFCSFMTISWARPLYAVLPYTSGIQFPFRWALPAMVLWLPLMAAALLDHTAVSDAAPADEAVSLQSDRGLRRSNPLVWVSRFIVAAILLAGLWLQSLYWALPTASLSEFFANPGHLQPFYPRSVPEPKKIPTFAADPHQLLIVKGSAEILDYQAGVAWMTAKIAAQTEAVLHINTHSDPYWQIHTADGSYLPITPLANDGTMMVTVPAGASEINLTRRAPAGRIPGWLIMLATMLILWRRWPSANDAPGQN